VPPETVRYEVRDDGVATIALDQPDTRNALSNELLTDLTAAFELARAAREKFGGDSLEDFLAAHRAYLDRIPWRTP
jgi:hypothetical protein